LTKPKVLDELQIETIDQSIRTATQCQRHTVRLLVAKGGKNTFTGQHVGDRHGHSKKNEKKELNGGKAYSMDRYL
jgi:hypothetical protein